MCFFTLSMLNVTYFSFNVWNHNEMYKIMVILKGDQEYAFKEVNECQAGYISLIFVLFVVSVSIEVSNLF